MRLVILISCLAATALGCGEVLEGASGSFSSPNYPNNYPNLADCEWTVSVPSGPINLKFTSFDLESDSRCRYDKVVVRDGSSTGAILGTFCGGSAPEVSGTGSTLVIQFTSDSSVRAGGFTATWGVAMCEGNGRQSCVARASACDGTVVDGLFCENNAVCCRPPFVQGPCGTTDVTPNFPSSARLMTLLNAGPRIVGGLEANPHSYPWMVLLSSSSSGTGSHFCGGSLVGDQWVLTAAHCTAGSTARNLYIRLGAHRRTSTNEGGVTVGVAQIVDHPSYNDRTIDYDFSLLKLASPVTFNSNIQPVCLANSDDPYPAGRPTVATGWGADAEGASMTSMLRDVQVAVQTISQCKSIHGNSDFTDRMLCAGPLAGGEDACQGDSGGPLVMSDNDGPDGKFTLVGVTSWGIGCARANYPGVYAKVSAVREWIDDTMMSN